jgi:hypothetical protein
MSLNIPLPTDEYGVLPYALKVSDFQYEKSKQTLYKLAKAKNLLKNNKEGFADTPSTVFNLNESTNKEMNAYIKPFNSVMNVMEDPLRKQKLAFDMYLLLQNQKMQSLDTEMSILEKQQAEVNNKYINNPKYGIIKSIKNTESSLLLNVDEYSPNGISTNNYTSSPINPNPTKPINNDLTKCSNFDNSNNNNYLIYGNNGCLSYNKDTNPSYAFIPCNANDTKQKFKINNVSDLCTFNSLTKNNFKLNNPNSVKLGFKAITPSNDNTQCLTAFPDSVTIQPCTLDNSQKFQAFNKSSYY